MIRRLFWCFVGVAVLDCAWTSARCVVVRISEEADSGFTSCGIVAEAVEETTEVAFVCPDAGSVGSCTRASLIGLNWTLLPRVAKPLGMESVRDWSGDVVVEAPSDVNDVGMSERGFRRVATNGLSALYRRLDGRAEPEVPVGVSHEPTRLTFGASVSVTLIIVTLIGLWICYGGVKSVGWWKLSCSLGILAVLLAVALPGGLNAPNGLGVYGGKAKLICLLKGLPDGFWTAPEYAVFQPSYPPLMTLVASLSFAIGGVSDRALQLFVPAVIALLFLELTRFAPLNGKRCWLVMLIVSLLLLSPEMINLARGFYAEPLAMLFIACGWNALLDGKPRHGWCALGLSALVRPEGLLIAGISWLVWTSFVSGWRSGKTIVMSAALALSPGAIWQLAMRFLGARLYDYDLLHFPGFQCFADACAQLVRSLVGDFAVNGGVFIFSALLVVLSVFDMSDENIGASFRCFVAAVIVTVLSLLAGAMLISFSTCPDREWLYEMTLPRYALLCVLPMMLVGVAVCGHRWSDERICKSTRVERRLLQDQ